MLVCLLQDVLVEAKLRLRDVSRNPANYKRLLTDFMVQVCEADSFEHDSLSLRSGRGMNTFASAVIGALKQGRRVHSHKHSNLPNYAGCAQAEGEERDRAVQAGGPHPSKGGRGASTQVSVCVCVCMHPNICVCVCECAHGKLYHSDPGEGGRGTSTQVSVFSELFCVGVLLQRPSTCVRTLSSLPIYLYTHAHTQLSHTRTHAGNSRAYSRRMHP